MTLRLEATVSGGYAGAPVLRDVGVAVREGEIVALLGANGAGKTTVLRALTGSLPTCTGSVTLDGADIGRLTPWARVRAGLALVPEGRHVFTAMTVTENLELAGLVGKGRTSRDDVFTLFPRLAERRGQEAGSLSGGEQQMLALGRALMTGPRVLLVDEMSAGLAPVIVEQLLDGLVQLRTLGLSVLLVEQSPHFVADIVDRVCLLDQGRVVGEGTLAMLGGADALAALYLGID